LERLVGMEGTKMISEPQQLSNLVDELGRASWTLAAIGTVFESGLAEALREPRTLDELAARIESLPRERIARCLAVVAAHGIVMRDGDRYALAPGALPYSRPPMRTDLCGELRSIMMQTVAYVDAATRPSPARGWYHTDPRILQAQGDSSVGFAGALAGPLGVALDGLGDQLRQPGARVLDVGVGVASLSIALARNFPDLKVVGLDTFDVPLALAHDNVARAELGDRIELRQLAIEDLREQSTYDLVWLPACFLAPSSVSAALARAHAALKPGGWLLLPTLNVDAPAEARAVGGLILEQWGNPTESVATAALVADAGFQVRTLPGPGWVALVAGHR
jgi:2-polyprenyl-3-methyl-5-hydroxy-6-metoxy-1,4-benzoquinol methylase